MKRSIILVVTVCLLFPLILAQFPIAQAQQGTSEPPKQETKEQKKPEPAVAVTDKDQLAWLTQADEVIAAKERELTLMKLGRSAGEGLVLKEMGLSPAVWMLKKTAAGYEAVQRPKPQPDPKTNQ
jgi:hypothetical protein